MADCQMCEHKFLSNLCEICGKEIEILNNDLSFSRELHNQSHKALADKNKVIDEESREISEITSDAALCTICNEHFEIVNNDFEISLELHSQNYKHQEFSMKNRQSVGTKELTTLDQIFDSFPTSLQSHRHFLYELENYRAFCKACTLMIGQFQNISDHLKTSIHEVNILSSLKQKLPINLLDVMRFVSFSGSNLCCNLCNFMIMLCSENIHETIINIIAHNACTMHITQKNAHDKLYNSINLNKENIEAPIQSNNLYKPSEHINKNYKTKSALQSLPEQNFENAYQLIKLPMDKLEPLESCESNNEKRVKLENVIRKPEDVLPKKCTNSWDTNELGQVVCSDCLCILPACPCNLKPQITVIENKGKKGKKFVNTLFNDMQLFLNKNKAYINVLTGDRNNVFCSKCKVKIPADHSLLLDHLREFNHNSGLLHNPIQEPCTKNEESKLATESVNKLHLTTTCIDVPAKKEIIRNVCLQKRKISMASELKCIVNEFLKELGTSNVNMNETVEVTCTVCKCKIVLPISHLQGYIPEMRQKDNEEEKIITSLFKQIPPTLQYSKFYIKTIPCEKKNFVHCTLCNDKIIAEYQCLRNHLRRSLHEESFSKTPMGYSIKMIYNHLLGPNHEELLKDLRFEQSSNGKPMVNGFNRNTSSQKSENGSYTYQTLPYETKPQFQEFSETEFSSAYVSKTGYRLDNLSSELTNVSNNVPKKSRKSLSDAGFEGDFQLPITPMQNVFFDMWMGVIICLVIYNCHQWATYEW